MRILLFLFLLIFPLSAQKNYSIYFNGSTLALKTVANYRSGDSQGTVSFWIKLDGNNANFTSYFSSADEASTNTWKLQVRRGTTNVLQVSEKNNDVETIVTTGTALTNNQWHWIVIKSSGTAYTVYIDSVKQSLSGTNSGDWFADIINRDNISVGGIKDLGGERLRLTGWMDDVFLSSDTKTDAWVQSTYRKYIGGTADLTSESNGVAYWRFDQTSTDAIGSTDLTISGTETYATDVGFKYVLTNTFKKHDSYNKFNGF